MQGTRALGWVIWNGLRSAKFKKEALGIPATQQKVQPGLRQRDWTHLSSHPWFASLPACPSKNSFRKVFKVYEKKRRQASSAQNIPAGVFGMPGLYSPADFRRLGHEAALEVERMIGVVNRGGLDGDQVLAIFDEISDTLCLVLDTAELCRSVHPDPEFVSAADAACAQLGSLVQRLNTDKGLYTTLVNAMDVAKKEGRWSEEQWRMATMLRADFERGGVHLSDSGRECVVRLQDEIARLCAQFQANIHSGCDPTVALPHSAAKTLPSSLQPYLKASSKEGDFLLTVTSGVQGLVLSSMWDEGIRKAVYLAYHTNASNMATLEALIAARHKLARKLGFSSYSAYALDDKMARTPERVQAFLQCVHAGMSNKANGELEVLNALKREGGSDTGVKAWDRGFLMNMAKARLIPKGKSKSYRMSEYLPLSRCLEGVALVLSSSFGIKMVAMPLPPTEAWCKHLHKFEMRRWGETLGELYLDLYARKNKLDGCAHFTVQCGRQMADGRYRCPRVALSFDFPRTDGNKGEPLLSHGQLETMFHEFGHVLHSMLGRTRYQHLSGTRTSLDIVEVPSTLMEYFVWEPSVLKRFARHYKTGDVIPDELLASITREKHAFAGLDTMQQVLYASLDIELHSSKPFKGPQHPPAGWSAQVLQSIATQMLPIPHVTGTVSHSLFSHLGSYGNNYYSYLWCRGLSASLWRNMFQRDPLREGAGDALVSLFLSHGGARDPESIMADLAASALTPPHTGGQQGAHRTNSSSERLLDDATNMERDTVLGDACSQLVEELNS